MSKKLSDEERAALEDLVVCGNPWPVRRWDQPPLTLEEEQVAAYQAREREVRRRQRQRDRADPPVNAGDVTSGR